MVKIKVDVAPGLQPNTQWVLQIPAGLGLLQQEKETLKREGIQQLQYSLQQLLKLHSSCVYPADPTQEAQQMGLLAAAATNPLVSQRTREAVITKFL